MNEKQDISLYIQAIQNKICLQLNKASLKYLNIKQLNLVSTSSYTPTIPQVPQTAINRQWFPYEASTGLGEENL